MGKKFAGQMDTEKAEAVEQRAYRFEGFPSQGQAHLLSQFIGSARFLWNRMLADWKDSYKETGKSALVRTPASYKEDPALAWLKGMDSLALANVQQNFQRAVKEFFSGEKGCPRFKKKHACPDTYTTNLSNRDKPNLRLSGCLLKLPKIREPIRLRVHRKVREGGLLKNCTVTREPDGRWYFSLLFEYPKQEIPKKTAGKGPEAWEAIGLDMSLPELYVDSDGNTPAYPKPYRKLERKIAREQRKLSRMEKDSRNYTKQLKKIAKLHAKAKHQRADFLHKLSYRLVTHYDIICIEDLDMSAIKKALSFGKSASDNGWGMFVRMLTYKAEWYGSIVIKVGKFFPSSKTCCACGHVHKELKLSDRVYVCPACGHVMGRDHQAAVNIRNEGVRIYIAAHSHVA